MDILITANSPGEIFGWLRPVLGALEKRLPDVRRVVVIPPCTFASGTESQVVRNLSGVSLVIESRDYLTWALWGKRPPYYLPSSQGVVLFLGGDLAHAVILARRLGWAVMAYSEGMVHWAKSFTRFLVPYSQTAEKVRARGVPPERIRVIGNLMVDGITYHFPRGELRQRLGAEGRPLVAMFPGSRPFEVKYLAGFFLRVAELVAEKVPETVFAYSLSPFITTQFFATVLAQPLPVLESQRGEIVEEEALLPAGRVWRLRSAGGLSLWALQGVQYDLMREADLGMNLPGTNNLEMAAIGLPMVVVIPLNKPEEIPLEGIIEYLGRLPWVGKALKRRAVREGLKKIPLVSWPNRLAGKMVAPELRGILTAQRVAEEILRLLEADEERAVMAQELKKAVGPGGAAMKLAEEVAAVLGR